MLLFIGATRYSSTIQTPLIGALNSIKSFYFFSIDYIHSTIEQHFQQAKRIESLEKKLRLCQNKELLLQQYKKELEQLLTLEKTKGKFLKGVSLVRAIAYEEFGDTNRIWLDFDDYNSSKIYGLVYKEYVAGIVIPKNNQPLALLNRDQKSAYAVMIGDEKAPGIAHGNDEKNIVVTYIPAWYNIKVGDEVVTSGLDDIFFQGIKVGKVLSITTAEGYKKVVVQPYFTQATLQEYFVIEGK